MDLGELPGMRKGAEKMMEKRKLVRRAAVALGATALMTAVVAPTASADGPSEIYLGTAGGQIDVNGGTQVHKYTDKQYRSTSLPNLRKHSIRVTYAGCAVWKARAAVKWGSNVDTEQQRVSGCNKSVLLTPMGDLNASVTLTIHMDPLDRSASKNIPPVH
ncbi:hypothetical protein ACGFY3_35705 [Streptomyces mirabilis]|uniref:hypothetical protein n=1 Tax=Streptomyces mirabilis TaxID=68239 RepID=UPI00371C31CB